MDIDFIDFTIKVVGCSGRFPEVQPNVIVRCSKFGKMLMFDNDKKDMYCIMADGNLELLPKISLKEASYYGSCNF